MRGRFRGVGIGLWAVGICIYALVLLITVPATLVDSRLQLASHGRLRLVEARGTLWSGSGHLEIRDAQQRTGATTTVSWQIRLRSLLRAELAYAVRSGPSPKSFPVTISWSRIEVENAELELPAAVLALSEPRLAPLGLTGDLQLKIPHLTAERRSVRGVATLQWRAASSKFSPVSPLGDYELQLAAEGTTARATLLTLNGPLQLDGTGSWASSGIPQFRVTARVPVAQQQPLVPLLRMIAVERAVGVFELQLQ